MSRTRSAKSRLQRGLFAIFGVVGIFALLCVVLWPRERLLLKQAYKLPLSANNLLSGQERFTTRAWRSDHEQLLLHSASGTPHYAVWTLDLQTNNQTLLQPFNDRFASELKFAPISEMPRRAVTVKKPVHYRSPQQLFSSDGKWLLWQREQTWRAFALDGRTQREWPRDPQENRYRRNVCWSSDNRSWLEPQYDNQFRINGARLHSLEASAPDEFRAFADSAGHWLLGVTHDHYLLTHDYPVNAVSAYTLYDTPLEPDHAPTLKINVRLPEGAEFWSITLSPDGSRLLWNLQMRREVSEYRPIQIFLGWFGMTAKMQNSLWVSKADGSDLREVGHVPAVLPPAPRPARVNPAPNVGQIVVTRQTMMFVKHLHDVQWLADSKHALFLDGNDVYEIGIE